MHAILGAVMALCVASAGAAAAPSPETYHLEAAIPVPGSATGWDYHAFDATSGRMFIAHRADGLQVYDTRAGAVVATIADSKNTNTAALATEFDIGIAGTTDGDVVVFKPTTLETLARYKSATAGFDGAAYDPVSRRFAMVGEADERTHRTPVLFFDGRTGQPAGTVIVDSAKVDAPRADGQGHLFLPLRDRARVAKVDSVALKVITTLPLAGCAQPAALELDRTTQRVFVGCRGDAKSAPALVVLDMASGRQRARLPIGRGVDEVLFDERAQAVMTANGEEGSLTVIRRLPQDHYRVTATIGTRPRARTGVLDPATGKIYLVTAQYIDTYPEGEDAKTAYLPDTFTVLTYAP